MMTCASRAGAMLPCAAGQYGIWQSASGAQLWFHLGASESGEVEIMGLTPYFEGKSTAVVVLSEIVRRDGDNAFEGALQGMLQAADAAGGDAYPVAFEAVDFAVACEGTLPRRQTVRLAAFARDMTAFANDEAFYAAQDAGAEPKLAAQSFIPIGLFAAATAGEAGPGETGVPASMALFTGRVADHNVLRNDDTQHDFHWLVVETLEATLDVVADPAVVKGEIAEGAIVEVSALMFGRILA